MVSSQPQTAGVLGRRRLEKLSMEKQEMRDTPASERTGVELEVSWLRDVQVTSNVDGGS